ncbi:MAG: hypothetical protein ACYTAF_10570 [Planctomycetota bacterium]|jgi:hypothetical protein
MPIWRNIVRLANAATAQAVVDPGPVDVATPAQAVQVLDDVSHTVSPVVVPLFFFAALSPAPGAGRHATIEFRPGPRGSLIRSVAGYQVAPPAWANNSDVDVWIQVGALILANPVAVPGATNFGVAALSTCTFGDVPTASISAAAAPFRALAAGTFVDLFVAPGQVVNLIRGTANLQAACALLVQDVP